MGRSKNNSVNEFDNSINRVAYPSKSKIEASGQEIKDNPPAILAKTARKSGKAKAAKQKVAIMLSKARKS